MKIKSVVFLLLCANVACANQINMTKVKPVDFQSESNAASDKEQDAEDFTDFGTEGEIDVAELAPPKMIVWLNAVFSRLCAVYNWFNSKN